MRYVIASTRAQAVLFAASRGWHAEDGLTVLVTMPHQLFGVSTDGNEFYQLEPVLRWSHDYFDCLTRLGIIGAKPHVFLT